MSPTGARHWPRPLQIEPRRAACSRAADGGRDSEMQTGKQWPTGQTRHGFTPIRAARPLPSSPRPSPQPCGAFSFFSRRARRNGAAWGRAGVVGSRVAPLFESNDAAPPGNSMPARRPPGNSMQGQPVARRAPGCLLPSGHYVGRRIPTGPSPGGGRPAHPRQLPGCFVSAHPDSGVVGVDVGHCLNY
ncbi:unnamed protein product [Amoebophrya sp. A120]|nr:unnamed protein product [Amoebophrya sp. A120]|eukprot:GSA120T00010193001.1